MSTSRRTTLADVARLAGVSGTTVSYILNGRADEMRISAETQQRVLAAVAELDYRPNRSARSLRTRTTKTIGVITDFVASGMFASRMLSGANAAARALDHVLVIGETEGDPSVERLLIDEMVERQVDGLIYVTRTTMELQAVGRPAGQPGRAAELRRPGPCSSRRSCPTSGPVAAPPPRRILASGLGADVHVVGEDPTPHALAGPLRLAGIAERLAESGVLLSGVVPCDWAVEPAYDAMGRWLDAGHRPRGLICLNDRVAMGVYQALGERGLRGARRRRGGLLRRLRARVLAAPAGDLGRAALRADGRPRRPAAARHGAGATPVRTWSRCRWSTGTRFALVATGVAAPVWGRRRENRPVGRRRL